MARRFGTLRSKLTVLNLAVFGVILNAVCIVVLTVGEKRVIQTGDIILTFDPVKPVYKGGEKVTVEWEVKEAIIYLEPPRRMVLSVEGY